MVGLDISAIRQHLYYEPDACKPVRLRLPQDVMYLIVQRFFRTTADVIPLWNTGDHACRDAHKRLQTLLPLAQANSEWRHACVPFLYMSVVCEETEKNRMPHDARHCYWRTNLRLFSPATAKHARRMYVLSSKNGSHVGELCAELTRGGFERMEWPRLLSLRLAIATSAFEAISPPAVVHSGGKSSYEGINGLCTYLRNNTIAMQSASQSDAPAADHMAATSGFCKEYLNDCRILFDAQNAGPRADGAIVQLRVDIADHLPAMQLHTLRVRYTDVAGASLVELVRATSLVLEDLSLFDVPTAGVPAVLTLGDFAGGVRFARLQSLSLSFVDSNNNRHRSQAGYFARVPKRHSLMFGKLRHLRVRNYPYDVTECLARFAADRHLDHVYVETSVIATLEELDLQLIRLSVRSLSVLCIGNMHMSERNAEAVLARLLIAKSNMHKLHIAMSLQYPVHIGGPVGCRSLRTLSLHVPIHLDQVAAMLPELPCLRILRIPYVSTAVVPQDDPRSIEELWTRLRHTRMPCVSASVELVDLGFWDYRQNTHVLCVQILYFLARIPSILTVAHDPGFAPTLRRSADYLVLLQDNLHSMTKREAVDCVLGQFRDLVITDHRKNISK
ncbi:hypothetical protein GGI25_004334 [Coemansia spiralis]|uniref:Uncharacterized protein n=2 Tax=Coemansia TaxID=4863 RepID=A0A9W8G6A6_9FUNG|nr:hypothetical protein BX070DRAFT_228364 [Coemansia spiralis]KAJ1992079.1 hypothetical protein EDC05_003070 [Coemansia umbellata]KAJ2621419.1 hypothetical protein GGI26_004101 [Coemansia sp. RSA 1358]KAJ2674394.1 hypothetical protein GGI25_004334 [Coemansia spiralis]